jgi:ribonuclease HII
VVTILGLDEAGRGSVIGPLVVGAFLVPHDRLDALVAAGAADSKSLSPARREEVYAAIAPIGRRRSIALAPREIDRWVVRGGLNQLEARAFARLVRELAPDRAHVDACDPVAERFGRLVRGLSGGETSVVARHHADRDDPVVGAASIVAKVRRDRAIAALARRIGTEFGSGYPSDRRTLEFLRQRCAGASPPVYVRASWGTMKRVKPHLPGPTLESFAP